MSGNRNSWRALTAVAAAFALVGAFVVAPTPPPASAISGSDFNPGNIISDALFYDGQAMTVGEIQAFLNSKIGSCSNGRCLNILTTSVSSRPREVSQTTGNLICDAFTGGSLSAAEIIYRAQVACGISAKVILVTLQKEQGLISSRAPGEAALDRAMGMACPDTAPCAEYALGFANQVYLGTRQLKAYKAAAFAKQPGVHQIQYHPNASCGSSSVNIQNYATAALYNYTPYRPNAAALANLGTVGDSCSSYGNRNFWWYYAIWFGEDVAPVVTSTNSLSHILGRDTDGNLSIHQPDSKGRLAVEESIGVGWQVMSTIIPAGDVTGDGNRDVLAIDANGEMWIYPTDGLTSWKTRISLGAGWDSYSSVFSADRFDRDDYADLMAIGADGNLWLFSGDGRGGFSEPKKIGVRWNTLDQVFSPGDFDGDGNADVIGRDSAGNLRLYRGNGAGLWLGAVQIGHGWDVMDTIFGAGDYDRDSANDVYARDSAGKLWVYRGNGRGGWLSRVQVSGDWSSFDLLVGPGPTAGEPYVAPPGFGDFNLDGARDVIAGDSEGEFFIYPGSGSGRWKSRVAVGSELGGMTLVATAGDLDADGSPDLVARNAAGELFRYPVASDGSLGEASSLGLEWNGYVNIFGAGDLDSDLHSDVLAVTDSGALWMFGGVGNGSLKPPVQVGSGWNVMTAVFNAGDFDNDGFTDLLARDADGRLWLYPGNANATWSPRVQVGSGWNVITAMLGPGDFDGDGNVDVLARLSSGELRIYPGNGKGRFSANYKVGSGWNIMDWIG
ncbi:MAG: FG-GAP repeat domain-containing protein [Salinibacterium amurskyense]